VNVHHLELFYYASRGNGGHHGGGAQHAVRASSNRRSIARRWRSSKNSLGVTLFQAAAVRALAAGPKALCSLFSVLLRARQDDGGIAGR